MNNNKVFFTSDWHLGEDRIGLNGKPNFFDRHFKSIKEQDITILDSFELAGFKDGDKLYHLGDVFYKATDHNQNLFREIRQKFPNSCFHLIEGNYDEGKNEWLAEFFDTITDEFIEKVGDELVYFNHYPAQCVDKLNFDLSGAIKYALTGHIHGLWKVQKNMINVGVDAWGFRLISEKDILFYRNAMVNVYDRNVFPY